MDSYSSSYSSSNMSPCLNQNPPEKAKEHKHAHRLQSHNNFKLHSVRKTLTKPWKNNKAPVAPMPPTPAKVYKVDPLNFKEVVQHLTSAPEFVPQQLQPIHHHHQLQPIDIYSRNNIAAATAASSPITHTNWFQDLQNELFGGKSEESSTEGAMAPGFLDMNLCSPSSFSNWCFFPLLSPGTMTSLEQGKVI
ncbi:hypothetical protein RIF29_34060 [Crotalaria pallida]|uniref:VQ domain-containing protein n=1 Tax=Crotalaria pallida TaxID=3830 RepID=A0AAN9EEF9_CROPI